MKKKIISLVAIVILASMMLVIFSGCTSYKPLKCCNIETQKNDFFVLLYQCYDTSEGKYEKNRFRVEVKLLKGDLAIYDDYVMCDYNQLSSGVQVELGDIKPSLYITGVTLDSIGKIAYTCTPKCEIRLAGRQYKANMYNYYQ